MRKIIFMILICIVLLSCDTYAYAIYTNNTISTRGINFYAIKNDGSLWAWNENDYDDDMLDNGMSGKETPIKIMDDVIAVSGDYAIKSDHSLWTWGERTLFSKVPYDTSIPIKVMDGVKFISYGGGHLLIIKDDNTLWGIGYNEYGQLGSGAQSFDYEMYYAPYFYDEPFKIMNNVQKVETGDSHSVVLKTDGSVWTFGDNSYGQLGIGDGLKRSNIPQKIFENAKDIDVGITASFAVMKDNTTWMCGTMFGNHTYDDNSLDKYIAERFVSNLKKISVHYKHSLILKNDNTLWHYIFKGNGKDVSEIQVADDVISISGWTDDTEYKTLVLKNSGELYTYNLGMDGYEYTKIMDNVELPEMINDAPIKSFIDISTKNKKTQVAINALSKAGIMEGTSDTEFCPDKLITRAEAAALLLRISAKAEDAGNGGFKDVTDDKWYYNTAGASKKYGIVLGFEDNTFRGDETVSRLQMALLVARVLRNESNFIDKKAETITHCNIPDWAIDDISFAEQEELISSEQDLITPDEAITRGDAAVILYRLYNKI